MVSSRNTANFSSFPFKDALVSLINGGNRPIDRPYAPIMTGVPTLVTVNYFAANLAGRRMQPCDAGRPGFIPAWSAIP